MWFNCLVVITVWTMWLASATVELGILLSVVFNGGGVVCSVCMTEVGVEVEV